MGDMSEKQHTEKEAAGQESGEVSAGGGTSEALSESGSPSEERAAEERAKDAATAAAGLAVVFSDNHLLVLNKPAGVPTVPDESGDLSLLEVAKEWVRTKKQKPGRVFLGVVHRLDRPVSGIVVFARTSKAAARLSEQVREQTVEKVYWGVVPQRPGSAQGQLDVWMRKDRRKNRSHIVREESGGAKRAITEWSVLEDAYPGSLLEFRPRTGRSHQLRVAARELGEAMHGDVKYGAAEPLPDRSVALHSRSFALEHPTLKERMSFQAPPPDEGWWDFPCCARARTADGDC
jgi:23S rRNA pseudouridine1911/1915/1917 synthase